MNLLFIKLMFNVCVFDQTKSDQNNFPLHLVKVMCAHLVWQSKEKSVLLIVHQNSNPGG